MSGFNIKSKMFIFKLISKV
jgi:hypothetical protein